eukprot:m.335462 g.335462  ORF g.335462 m.335462 type:complete len:88 (-) comp17600_c0_seq1:1447-1710(-)
MSSIPQLRQKGKCLPEIEAFETCHNKYAVSRWMGACNDLRQELVFCIRRERVSRQKNNLEQARHLNEKLQKKREQYLRDVGELPAES